MEIPTGEGQMAVHNVVGARGWAMYCKAMNVGYKCVAAWNEPRYGRVCGLSNEYVSSTVSCVEYGLFGQVISARLCQFSRNSWLWHSVSYRLMRRSRLRGACPPVISYSPTRSRLLTLPLDVADPAVKALDLAVTPEGKCSIKFILYDDTNALGFFSAPYTFEDEVHLVLYGVEGVHPFLRG
ncbi:hypothetical protein FOZ60_002555 [Perkinsus olseni]|uniref:Uncharacterized protein n=1 Tax=Perkinsus olseni TaxID=32597 RepID=A0A7J6NXK1_PEROL|nr:hypothetical protein FOZ60_002555 [Perkinsus olseni]